MTSRERLLSAYRCEEPDGLPIMVRGVRCWDEQWVATRHPSYQPVIEVVAEHGDYQAGWASAEEFCFPGGSTSKGPFIPPFLGLPASHLLIANGKSG